MSNEVIGKILQLMSILIAESAKAGPFIKHLLVLKHPVLAAGAISTGA